MASPAKPTPRSESIDTPPEPAPDNMATAVFLGATLISIAWLTFLSLPQGRMTPGFGQFALNFSARLALPYVLSLAMLFWRDGSAGQRMAFGTAVVNALWAIPLAGLLLVFGGFTLGDRSQEAALGAVAICAALQIPLMLASGIALRRAHHGRSANFSPSASTGAGWVLAFMLPIAASGSSFALAQERFRGFSENSKLAAGNSRAAQETVRLLQACLEAYRDKGYPSRLSVCGEAESRTSESSGYRFEYVTSVPGADGRIGAYMICAEPRTYLLTGVDVVVANSTGAFGAGTAWGASANTPPTCTSAQGVNLAMAFCAFTHAGRRPAAGYPARFSEMSNCVMQYRKVAEVHAHGLTDDRTQERFDYIAGPARSDGRVTRFRIYRARGPDDSVRFVDEHFQEIKRLQPTIDAEMIAARASTPAKASPERFEPGCQAGQAMDCFLAGSEWERKSRQLPESERQTGAAALSRKSMDAHIRGCDLGAAGSCADLAWAYERGTGVTRDAVRAARLYERACGLDLALGCNRAGAMFERDREGHSPTLASRSKGTPDQPELPADRGRSIYFYARACNLGEREACLVGGNLLAQPGASEPNRAEAIRMLERACDDGLSHACANAAEIAPGRAEEFRFRACVLSGSAACR